MPKDKKKGKDEELDLASLKGMVRLRAIFRKYGVSPHVADLATEALDDMFEKAVSDLKAEIRWGVTIISTLIAIVGIIVAIATFKG